MRTIYKARLVPDSAPDGLTTKVIRVEDLGVPVALALGRWDGLTEEEIDAFEHRWAHYLLEDRR